MTKDDRYVAVMFEQIRDQNKAVLEAVAQLQQSSKKYATKADLARVEAKVDTIKAAVTDTNQDMTRLDNRLTLVEQAL